MNAFQNVGLQGERVNKNTVLGYHALYETFHDDEGLEPGFDNTAIGYEALRDLEAGNNENTAVGSGALRFATSGENTAVGAHALQNNGEKDDNTAVGNWAMRYVEGDENVAVGSRAMSGDRDSDTIAEDTGYADRDKIPLSHGDRNVAVGAFAMEFAPQGDNNVAVGYKAMNDIACAENDVAVGSQALAHVTNGNHNVAVGYEALHYLTEQEKNTAVGTRAMRHLGRHIRRVDRNDLDEIPGKDNVAVGHEAMLDATHCNSSTACGFRALLHITRGRENTALGRDTGSVIRRGNDNTFVGIRANSDADGDFRTAIGADAIVGQDNSIVLGRTTDNVGIGTIAPDSTLEVVGHDTVDALHTQQTSTAITGTGVALWVDGGIRNKVILPPTSSAYTASINDYIIIMQNVPVGFSGPISVILPDPVLIPVGQTYIVRNASTLSIVVDTPNMTSAPDFFPFGTVATQMDTIPSGVAATYVNTFSNTANANLYYRIA
jgi:hypothetical protein